MPTYTFALRDGTCGIEDRSGVILPDREQARLYAIDVAHELMSGCEAQTRSWRLDVYDDNAERILSLPFASIDATLDHLTPQWRALIQEGSDRNLSVSEAVHAAHDTVRESRSLLACSQGKPYLVTSLGRKTIRGH